MSKIVCPECQGQISLWIDVALEEPFALCYPCALIWDQVGREVEEWR